MTMAIVANSSPNYAASLASYGTPPDEPIMTSAGVPAGLTFVDNINGLMQAVFSYGGATLFCELMAEMRRPFDFWKGMIIAETFIFLCYIVSTKPTQNDFSNKELMYNRSSVWSSTLTKDNTHTTLPIKESTLTPGKQSETYYPSSPAS